MQLQVLGAAAGGGAPAELRVSRPCRYARPPAAPPPACLPRRQVLVEPGLNREVDRIELANAQFSGADPDGVARPPCPCALYVRTRHSQPRTFPLR